MLLHYHILSDYAPVKYIYKNVRIDQVGDVPLCRFACGSGIRETELCCNLLQPQS